ncbi:Anaphase-promoting complex subunit 1 [Puccinia graminis f. sp. tritici]|uniref:Anaphase-promoting complex subunit 1 n=1 Tax=Puccinia graminis f. sp. tritici TaxID=56615 RepID=A0A5B0M1M5_PUCGR|nr:Anaphase-promoting complex subunit 1 [Puccinia graminis f. sp. tritici]
MAASHLVGLSPGLQYFSQNYQNHPSSSPTQSSSPILPHLPPPRPPPNPFSCLDSLRSLEKNLTQPNLFDETHQQTSDWSTGINRFIVRAPVANRSHTDSINSNPVFEDEELCWKASTLIWSKGSLIFRKFDYSTTNSSFSQDSTPTTSRQHVIQALFAYFDPPSSTDPSTTGTPADHLQAHLSFEDQLESTPFEKSKNPSRTSYLQTTPTEPWSDNRLTQRSDQQKRWRSSTTTPVRALCVLLSEVFKIYFDTGEEYTLAVPFPIQKVWPIERGVMMMKKPTSVRPRPFIRTSQVSPGPSNQLKLRSMSIRRSILGDSRLPSSAQAASTSELLGFDSMITENETHLWSSFTGADLEDRQAPDHDQLEDGDDGADERDLSAELARYWAERKQIESSMLWTLSDPCTNYLQPVLTTERLILPDISTESTPSTKTSDEQNNSANGKHATSPKFCKAFVPLAPLVTPSRRPGCALSSGTVVYVADPKMDPHHPICITASTEGFTILLYGRLPSNASTPSGLISPFECPSPVAIPEEDPIEEEIFLNPLRSPTPPSQSQLADEPQLRRSPRKNTASRSHLSPVEHLKSNRQLPKPSMDAHKLSPTLSRTTRTLPRLGGLGHPSLRRSLNNSQGSTAASISIKKRGMNAGPAANSNVVGGRRVSVVSNASNASFAFGSSVGPSSAIPGGNPMSKSSNRKSLAEQQLEMMSGAASGNRIGTVNSEKVGHLIGLDREAGGGFDEWFDGIMDSEPSDRKIDGHLADQALEPEFVIQTLETVEIPGRLTAEELPSIHATVYDSRGPTAYLAICIPTRATVYVFRMTRTRNSIFIRSVGKPWEGTAIGAVLCSRPNVYDLFKFSNSTGLVDIVSADSAFLHQFSHPDTVWSAERSVKSSVSYHVEFISPLATVKHQSGATPKVIRADLKIWPSNPLIRKVFQVLSEEIGNIQACYLVQRYIKHNSAFKSTIDCLDVVLYEALIGEEVQQAKKNGDDSSNPEPELGSIVNQISGLSSDPALNHLRAIRRLKQPNPPHQTDHSQTKPPGSPKKRRTQPVFGRGLPLNPQLKTKVMIGLAKLYADLKASMSCLEQHVTLGKILLKLSSCLGWIDWSDSLKRSLNGTIDATFSFSACYTGKLEEPKMPDLCDHLDRIRLAINSPFDELFEKSADDLNPGQVYQRPNVGFYGGPESCQLTKQITKLYRILFKPDQSLLQAAKGVLIEIDRFGWGLDELDDLWFGIAVPLKEALRYCQYRAPQGLSARCYQLMGRPDLAMLTEQANETVAKDLKVNARRPALRSNSSFHITTQPPPSISQLCAAAVLIEDPVFPPAELDFHSLEEASPDHSVAARFSDDMRIIDAAKMLNYTREVKVKMHESIAEMTSTDVARHYSSFFVGIIRRTMSLPFGGACFWYKTDSNVAANVPMIKLDIRISSPAILIQPDLAKVEPLAWPRFHAGVAAGLSLSVRPEEFDSSQISLARPEELDDRHAGYLLGLGLNQHLRSINRVQIFRYLETKHEMTSIGVLLGLSSAFIGTADPRVSSIIAAHVPAMHPTESIQLQVSPLTQSAGFVSFGILHLGTANRRLSDGMLREMGRTWRVLTDTPDGCRESYTLCAGIGYGLVMLGKGTESDTPAHKDLMRTFKSLIQGDGAHPLPGLNQPTTTIDVSVTSPAATLALALLYLKTGRSEAAMLCEIPQTPARLEYIRPDLLMIRTLARGLIMWQSIKVDMDWMESFVPPVILEAIERAEKQKKKLRADWEMSYWSIICGAALAMALKYAGSADCAVHSTLLTLYDRLFKAISKPALHVQAKVRRTCLRSCHNVVTLGLAIVMAGTGELEILKRLRLAHGNTTETTGYGTHVVTHLALGLLFLGGGRYTFNTSDRAVACLLCALYPIFPSRTDDHVHHLQALRHLWVLAAEPRCLVARDVDRKGELIFLPVKLKMQERPSGSHTPSSSVDREPQMDVEPPIPVREKLKSKLLTAPTLVPEMEVIQSVKVESPRYWPFVLDLATNSYHRNYFSKSLSLWVKRKVGHLSYSQDPKGAKSIASRGRGAEEMMTCEIDHFGLRSREIRKAMKSRSMAEQPVMGHESPENLYELIEGFDLDEQSIGLVDYLGSLTPPRRKENGNRSGVDLSAYASTALLQCLLEDKLEVFPTYLALFACSKTAVDYQTRLATQYIPDQQWQISNLVRFYGDDQCLNEIGSKFPSSSSFSSSTLLDRNLLIQIQHYHQQELMEWADSLQGSQLILKYFKSDGELIQSPSNKVDSSSSSTPDPKGARVDGELEDRSARIDEERLADWLRMMHVPLPKTLKVLRAFLTTQIRTDHPPPNPLLQSSPGQLCNHHHLKYQLLVKNLLRLPTSADSLSPQSARKNIDDLRMQFLKLLVDSCCSIS